MSYFSCPTARLGIGARRFVPLTPGLWLLLLVAVSTWLGCDSGSSESPFPTEVRPLTPQESFDQIASYVTRQLKETDDARGRNGSYLFRGDDATARLVYTFEIQPSPVQPPETPEEPHRADIVITFRTSYSRNQFRSDQKTSADETASHQDALPEEDSLLPSGVEILDPELVPELPGEFSPSAPLPLPQRNSTTSEVVTVYSFEYGPAEPRWRLVGTSQPEPPRSADMVIQQALQRQEH